MRLSFLLLFSIALCTSNSAQQISQKDLVPCIEGKYYSISKYVDQDTTRFYMLYPSDSDDEYEYVDLFLSYEIETVDKNRGGQVLSLQGVSHIEESAMLVNMDFGQVIVKSRDSQSIQYIPEFNVFIVNREDISDRIVDLEGNTLYSSDKDPIRYSSLGFYEEKSSDDLTAYQTFFDSKGAELMRIENFRMVEEIDNNNFLGLRLMDCYGDSLYSSVLLDSLGHTNFNANNGCCFIAANRSCAKCSPELIVFNFIDFDESMTILKKNKKGKWYAPIAKFHKHNYVTYVKDLTANEAPPVVVNGKKVYYYATVEDDLSYLLSKNAKIILMLDKPIPAERVTVESGVISVYDKSGSLQKFSSEGKIISE